MNKGNEHATTEDNDNKVEVEEKTLRFNEKRIEKTTSSNWSSRKAFLDEENVYKMTRGG